MARCRTFASSDDALVSAHRHASTVETTAGSSLGATDSATTPISSASGDRRDPLAGLRALGTPGVYRNRMGGSWVNVPPPDRHYDRPADPSTPTGAG